MKSIFAKIVDSTVGAALVFCAAFAVIRYFAPLPTAMFGAACVTFSAVAALWFKSGKTASKAKISKAADAMFFDFMFLPNTAPARMLAKALNGRGENATARGDGLYVGKTAAYFAFDAPPDEKALARTIARAKHFGAKKAVVFCKTAPTAKLQVNDFELSFVCGDDVYRLFASLDALPEHKFEKPKRSRRAVLRAAIGKDKILKYAVLSAALFFAAWLTGSIASLVCASVCAALALAAGIATAVKNAECRIKNFMGGN